MEAAQPNGADRLDLLLTREAIRDAIYDIASGVDRYDQSLLQENIWEDAILDMGGAAAIEAEKFIAALKPPAQPAKGRMHVVTNIRIRIAGDSARVESLILSCQQLTADEGDVTRLRAGRYLDLFEQRRGKWKLRERTLIDEWAREDAVRASPASGRHRGAPFPNDLVCQHFATVQA